MRVVQEDQFKAQPQSNQALAAVRREIETKIINIIMLVY